MGCAYLNSFKCFDINLNNDEFICVLSSFIILLTCTTRQQSTVSLAAVSLITEWFYNINCIILFSNHCTAYKTKCGRYACNMSIGLYCKICSDLFEGALSFFAMSGGYLERPMLKDIILIMILF